MSVTAEHDTMAELISACAELPGIVLPADVLAHGAWPGARPVFDAPAEPGWDSTVAAIARVSGHRDWAPPAR